MDIPPRLRRDRLPPDGGGRLAVRVRDLAQGWRLTVAYRSHRDNRRWSRVGRLAWSAM